MEHLHLLQDVRILNSNIVLIPFILHATTKRLPKLRTNYAETAAPSQNAAAIDPGQIPFEVSPYDTNKRSMQSLQYHSGAFDEQIEVKVGPEDKSFSMHMVRKRHSEMFQHARHY